MPPIRKVQVYRLRRNLYFRGRDLVTCARASRLSASMAFDRTLRRGGTALFDVIISRSGQINASNSLESLNSNIREMRNGFK